MKIGSAKHSKPELRTKTRDTGSMVIACSIVAFLLCAKPMAAAQSTYAGAEQLEVVAKTVTGDAYRGQWLSLSLDGGLLLRSADGEKIHVATDDLVRIETVAVSPSKQIDGFRVKTIGRNTFYGRLAWSENSEKLRIVSPDMGELDVSLDDLLSIEKVAADSSDEILVSKWIRSAIDSASDRILTTNGDTVSGFVAGTAPTGMVIDTGSGEATIAFGHIAAISMANMQAAVMPSKHFMVTMYSSSKITTKYCSLSQNPLSLGMPNGQRIDVDPQQVRAIEVIGARWVWLSSLEPISDQHSPMLSLSWPMKRDRNVLGYPIKLAGETFTHGLGVHSRSNVSYDLRGQYVEFVTFFGLDDSAGPLADVDIRILIDGRKLYEKLGISVGTLHGPIRIDIRQANHLELIVDFGQRGDVQDRFNWIEPAFVR